MAKMTLGDIILWIFIIIWIVLVIWYVFGGSPLIQELFLAMIPIVVGLALRMQSSLIEMKTKLESTLTETDEKLNSVLKTVSLYQKFGKLEERVSGLEKETLDQSTLSILNLIPKD